MPAIPGWLTWKLGGTILKYAIPVAAILALALVVRNHVRYVEGLEGDNKTLIADKTKLQGQVDDVVKVNAENTRLANEYRALQKVNKQIGDAEDLIAATRNDFYERLSDEISQNAPTPGQCDTAVIQRSLDSLWARSPGS